VVPRAAYQLTLANHEPPADPRYLRIDDGCCRSAAQRAALFLFIATVQVLLLRSFLAVISRFRDLALRLRAKKPDLAIGDGLL
jgi:hypothetical protein